MGDKMVTDAKDRIEFEEEKKNVSKLWLCRKNTEGGSYDRGNQYDSYRYVFEQIPWRKGNRGPDSLG